MLTVLFQARAIRSAHCERYFPLVLFTAQYRVAASPNPLVRPLRPYRSEKKCLVEPRRTFSSRADRDPAFPSPSPFTARKVGAIKAEAARGVVRRHIASERREVRRVFAAHLHARNALLHVCLIGRSR